MEPLNTKEVSCKTYIVFVFFFFSLKRKCRQEKMTWNKAAIYSNFTLMNNGFQNLGTLIPQLLDMKWHNLPLNSNNTFKMNTWRLSNKWYKNPIQTYIVNAKHNNNQSKWLYASSSQLEPNRVETYEKKKKKRRHGTSPSLKKHTDALTDRTKLIDTKRKIKENRHATFQIQAQPNEV